MTEKLKERFCKDTKLSIKVFAEPYFSERIALMGKEEEWKEFVKLIETRFENDEQKYFEAYNHLKDDIIDYIKSSDAFKDLNARDMNEFNVMTNVQEGDVFKEPYIGHRFISIDLAKANFSALVAYGKEYNCPFGNDNYSWTDFVNMFTDVDYFAKSKYIRQVVFGNCNPKRQMKYEKVLINRLFNQIVEKTNDVSNYDVYSMFISTRLRRHCNDELVFDADGLTENQIIEFKKIVEDIADIPIHFEYFELYKVAGTRAFVKKIMPLKNMESVEYELKCCNALDTILTLKKLKNIPLEEDDKVFMSEFGLAKLLDLPEVKIDNGRR